ncbi:MAG: protoporphyrinogen oxidase, partial [Jatrophihabitans sp.]
GAEAMLARRPEGVELVRAAGLGDDLVAPLTTSAQVYARHARHPLPPRTMMGIPGDPATLAGLLEAAEIDRVAREPQTPPVILDGDVAVGPLVRARFGDPVADLLVDPLLGGVYAGRADALSLEATVPALFRELSAGPTSLLRAVEALVDRGAHDPSAGPVFASLRGGLGRLPEALAGAGRFAVRTGTTVRQIERTAAGLRLVCGAVPAPEVIAADAVVVATPAPKAARLLGGIVPAAAAALGGIETASVAIVTLAYRDVDLPAGSGLLVAATEGSAVKAVTLSTQKWPLETGGTTVLRASVGRAGEGPVLQREDRELVELVRQDLRVLLGVDRTPIDTLVTRWGGALPQYAVGHVGRIARARGALAAAPALAVCGAYLDGVGIPACIASARVAAERVLAHLGAGGQ